MTKNKITISEEDKNKRLDHFLVEKLPDFSRSFLQKEIKAGRVLVNGEMPSVHQFLKAGDKIEVKKITKAAAPKLPSLKYKLIDETKNYLIVEKPSGLLTHAAGDELGLADEILKDYPEIKKVGEEGREGIVHRLDKDASGLLVIARTKKFFDYIKLQFKERTIKKIYLALVYGEIKKDEDTVEFSIGRRSGGRMAARAKDEEGREAKTNIKVLERYKNYTYISAQIFTGRTHQIRAHMLAYGCPIIGDKLYQTRKQQIKDPGCGRLFLHSHILGFTDMAGKWVEYKSELPKNLKDCLEKLV